MFFTYKVPNPPMMNTSDAFRCTGPLIAMDTGHVDAISDGAVSIILQEIHYCTAPLADPMAAA